MSSLRTKSYSLFFFNWQIFSSIIALWPRSQIGGLVSQRLSPRGALTGKTFYIDFFLLNYISSLLNFSIFTIFLHLSIHLSNLNFSFVLIKIATNGNGSATVPPKKTRRRVASMAQRRAANIRERRRMFNLNEAFDKLRRKVRIWSQKCFNFFPFCFWFPVIFPLFFTFISNF